MGLRWGESDRGITGGPRSGFFAVAGGAVEYDALEAVIKAQSGFGAAKEQVTAGAEGGADFSENGLFCFHVEIDQDISEEYDVEGGHEGPVLYEIQFTEGDAFSEGFVENPVVARSSEIFYEESCRQATIDLELGVPAGDGLSQHFLREIGREEVQSPLKELRGTLCKGHQHAATLLAGGGRTAPEVELPLRAALSEEFREDVFFESFKRVEIAEEGGLVGGHRIDHLFV